MATISKIDQLIEQSEKDKELKNTMARQLGKQEQYLKSILNMVNRIDLGPRNKYIEDLLVGFTENSIELNKEMYQSLLESV